MIAAQKQQGRGVRPVWTHLARMPLREVAFFGCALVAALMLCLPARAQRRDGFESARRDMVETAVAGAGITDGRVLEALRNTPRHEFVRPHLRSQAYQDKALPIGNQQTISSPFIVAFMTESLDPQPTDRVLEIGTGSGYQAAVLSPLVDHVYSIEIVDTLGRRAQRNLRRLRYHNVTVKVGDGFKGWPEHAPFDKIIVTCSPEEIPDPLVDQLREGGLLVIPVGRRYQQTLYLMRKTNGELHAESLRPTLFVPMTGTAEKRRRVKEDPRNPRVVNGDFEEPLSDTGFVPGWYYQRQLRLVTDSEAPDGDHFAVFENDDMGRSAHLLQGFAIDGRKVRSIRLSASVRTDRVRPGSERLERPMLAVTFYDEYRRDLGLFYAPVGSGSSDWLRVVKTFRVPSEAREGILRIGLFGATGSVCFDAVQLEAAMD